MIDFRAVERVLVEAFRGEGYAIKDGGDKFAERGGTCFLAQAGEACPGITPRSVNLTRIAKAVAEEVG